MIRPAPARADAPGPKPRDLGYRSSSIWVAMHTKNTTKKARRPKPGIYAAPKEPIRVPATMPGANPRTKRHSTEPRRAWDRALDTDVNRMLDSEVATATCMATSGDMTP